MIKKNNAIKDQENESHAGTNRLEESEIGTDDHGSRAYNNSGEK